MKKPYILAQKCMKTIQNIRTPKEKKLMSRHNDNFNNVNYAGFYATNLLWNKPTLKESIKNTNEKFNVNMKLK